jgi:hypothetical protein
MALARAVADGFPIVGVSFVISRSASGCAYDTAGFSAPAGGPARLRDNPQRPMKNSDRCSQMPGRSTRFCPENLQFVRWRAACST